MNTQIALRIFTVPLLLIIALIAGVCHAADFAARLISRPLNQPLDAFLVEETLNPEP